MKKKENGPKVSRNLRMLGVSSLELEQKKSLDTNLILRLRRLLRKAW